MGSRTLFFSRGMTQLMSWPDGERYSCSLQSPVVSLLSLVSTLVFFSDWRRIVSPEFFDIQVPLISTEGFVLLHDARGLLSSLLQQTQSSVKFLSL